MRRSFASRDAMKEESKQTQGPSPPKVRTGKRETAEASSTTEQASEEQLAFKCKYTHRQSKPDAYGKWTAEEHRRFLYALDLFGNSWKAIQRVVGNRSCAQIRSHAQKYVQGKRKEAVKRLLDSAQGKNKLFVVYKAYWATNTGNTLTPTQEQLIEHAKRNLEATQPQPLEEFVSQPPSEAEQRPVASIDSSIQPGPGPEREPESETWVVSAPEGTSSVLQCEFGDLPPLDLSSGPLESLTSPKHLNEIVRLEAYPTHSNKWLSLFHDGWEPESEDMQGTQINHSFIVEDLFAEKGDNLKQDESCCISSPPAKRGTYEFNS